MKRETNTKRTGCYSRRKRFILGAAAGLLLAAALPFGALGAEKGWHTIDGAERYVDENGGIVTEQWRNRDGRSYYLDENGEIVKDAWIQGTWHVDENGAMEKEAWIYEDGSSGMAEGWYYLGPGGRAEKNDWKKLGDVRYSFDSQGRMRTGWHYENGDIYYLGDEDQGYTQSGWRYLESDGIKRPAEGSVSKALSPGAAGGQWYYFNSAGKARRAEDGSYKESDIDGHRYYFDANGVMAVGWHCVREQAKPGDGTGISRFVYLGGKDEGMLKNQWLETEERPWDSPEWEQALSKEARRAQNASETAQTKKDMTRRFYLQHDGTPAFLSADAVQIWDAVTKLDGAYYFFDSYGVQQSGLIRMTSGGKTETAWFDPDRDGALLTGRAETVRDKNGKAFTFCAETSGSLKGTGVNGEKDGFLYYNGLLTAAPEGMGYACFKIGDQTWTADETGRIQPENKMRGAETAALPAAGWEISYVR